MVKSLYFWLLEYLVYISFRTWNLAWSLTCLLSSCLRLRAPQDKCVLTFLFYIPRVIRGPAGWLELNQIILDYQGKGFCGISQKVCWLKVWRIKSHDEKVTVLLTESVSRNQFPGIVVFFLKHGWNSKLKKKRRRRRRSVNWSMA